MLQIADCTERKRNQSSHQYGAVLFHLLDIGEYCCMASVTTFYVANSVRLIYFCIFAN